MPRIRTIKPEFWASPSVAAASPYARLTFIGMWNWADDFGRGTLNYKELEGFIFPHDDTFTDRSGNTVTFRDVVAEVSERFGVVLYEVSGRSFFAIPTWDKHQRNEKRAKESKYPAPPQNSAPSLGRAESVGKSAPVSRKSSDVPRSSGPGTGEQGNRGTGEQTPTAHPQADERREPSDEFEKFWKTYPRKVGKGAAQKAWAKATKAASADTILTSLTEQLSSMHMQKRPDGDFRPHPATWLNERRWEDDPEPATLMTDTRAIPTDHWNNGGTFFDDWRTKR